MLITLKSKLSFPVYRQIGEWLVYVGIHSGMGQLLCQITLPFSSFFLGNQITLFWINGDMLQTIHNIIKLLLLLHHLVPKVVNYGAMC